MLSKFKLALAIGASCVFMQAAQAQQIVIVNGTPETCYGSCFGGLPMVNVGYPVFGGGGGVGNQGGSGGSNSSAGYDDYSRGNQPVFNRAPGCVREGMFYKETVDKLSQYAAGNGTPPGVVIMDSFNDPLFKNDPGWKKFHTETRGHRINTATGRYTIWRPQIHYMLNIVTGQFTQVKMKNSYELGCVGMNAMEPI
jgi:hypothetical protein